MNSEPPGAVVVIDVANVLGSRPDGWWRDRASAATRLLEGLAPLIGSHATGSDGNALRIDRIVAVLEGAAVAASGPPGPEAVRAERDGDSTIVAQARKLVGAGQLAVLVVTADRALRRRLPPGVAAVGPNWLNRLMGR